MGRNLSPALRRELANLDKDAASRKSAMKALKLYVKDLDSKAIPLFLEQVSETKETGELSGEYTISLYEVLARVHGVNIVPQIDSIMATIIKTLSSSAGSFPLQQACARVVPAIARYGIDPTTPDHKKRHIIHSLCKSLAESLLACQESLASGSALCLKVLVESDNWKYASHEMVNKVCQNVTAALEEKSSQTNPHMDLVMALAKHNAQTVEAYARLLVQSGLKILHAGVTEGNSNKRFYAIQMVTYLMKWLDRRSISSELQSVIDEMKKCEFDQMPYVKGAALEAQQLAEKLVSEKEMKYVNDHSNSITGSNFGRSRTPKKSSLHSGMTSPTSHSPESLTFDFSMEYDSLESPLTSAQGSPTSFHNRWSASGKPYRYQGRVVDVSLKDGLFSDSSNGYCVNSAGASDGIDDVQDFAGFQPRSPSNYLGRTPSPQRPGSQLDVKDVRIFSTPRKLIHSLQEMCDRDSDVSEKQAQYGSPCSSTSEWSPLRKYDQNGSTDKLNVIEEQGSSYSGDKQLSNYLFSMSPKDRVSSHSEDQVMPVPFDLDGVGPQGGLCTTSSWKKTNFIRTICSTLFVFVAIASMLLINEGDTEDYLVPT
ncbi:hypothetical protein MLD38_004570 [Melastoma candidum]|uniref:Uncharacterized protein n=1 Tax=Melastoma candidum TaxID=119954 RepID=A0ACB9S671_9MYRT|nr:hypothetical protein MLD38_004570 [Melastoma candidum]